MRSFDFGPVLPPNTYDVESEQRCELIHVMPVPSVRKSGSDMLGLAVRYAHDPTPPAYFRQPYRSRKPDATTAKVKFQLKRGIGCGMLLGFLRGDNGRVDHGRHAAY
ncbi:hypothetical protein LB577_00775 [Mesorhizobium sp. B283B1A]|uniref:hypothetical protein n=1 Tax=Mesorhizobium TaxID=68287 RepID=UPI001CD0C5B9|nr:MULTISPECIES: hypothetical protein [Mesorhizobium]MCA0045496.1 hypothetical protein [Mesorhizobium sp. B283B1A]UQS68217.1 hypothetical protein M5D98_25710 [Mesorhizobium opportunistum]